jgi:site-specific DNA-cytosine methylase
VAGFRNPKPPTLGSLFSGIGGFDLGFEQAGFKTLWQVEKEPFANAVLATHWPKVKRFTDVRKVGKRNLEKVDCIAAGVPCQDVSVAGKRAGLAGARTGLFFEFARILQELRPTWFIFENVPGLFSSNKGRDFAEILRVLMVECGYGVSWRVLDSRYFNVAQRRERVFIVGRFGKPCPAEILFESPSGAGNPAKGRKAWQNIANSLTEGSGRVGSKGCDDGANNIAGALGGGDNGTGRRTEYDPNLAVTLSSGNGDKSRYAGRRREDDFNIVSHSLTNSRNGRLDPNGETFVCNAISPVRGGADDNDAQGNHIVAHALRSADGHHGRSSPRGDGSDNLVTSIQDVRGGTRDRTDSGQGIGISAPGAPMYTLSKTEQHAVAFAENQRGEVRTSDVAPQLSAGGGKPGSGYPAVAYPLRENAHNNSDGGSVNLAYALRKDPGGTGQAHNCTYIIDEERSGEQFEPAAKVDGAVQRNADDGAPLDADRVRDLAGISEEMDDSLPKGMDSPRYRALGNAVTVSTVRWIAERLKKAHMSFGIRK